MDIILWNNLESVTAEYEKWTRLVLSSQNAHSLPESSISSTDFQAYPHNSNSDKAHCRSKKLNTYIVTKHILIHISNDTFFDTQVFLEQSD